MKEKAILHCDINHCYAQIEEMKYPELRNVPMVVGGKEETRSGIVLARNLRAKKYGIKTAETLREALDKCPELCIIHPSYDDYVYYSEKIKDIYREYTDKVESFGVDEAWIDVSDSRLLFGSEEKIAKEIQTRVLDEYGITISVGVSFNKIFAKLGSDMTKPSGFHVITKENYKEVVWPLDVNELLYVGPQTTKKLNAIDIMTIGDLAQSDVTKLKKLLGKPGEIIWAFANGLDESDVSIDEILPKSIGNGITTPRNLEDFLEVKHVLYVLVESVAARLKEQNLEGNVISLSLRDTNLESMSRQKKLLHHTDLVDEIMDVLFYLINHAFDFTPPYRSLSVKVSGLRIKQNTVQLDLFSSPEDKTKAYTLENTIEDLRDKYGFEIIKRASLLVDEDLTNFDPKRTHTIHPVGFFK